MKFFSFHLLQKLCKYFVRDKLVPTKLYQSFLPSVRDRYTQTSPRKKYFRAGKVAKGNVGREPELEFCVDRSNKQSLQIY